MRLMHWDALNPHSIPPGQPYLWDDPNLFFSADGLGYAREPGDAGFVPYLPPTPSPAHPHRTSLVQVIQEAPGYNDTLGTDLGIIGSAATAPDLNGVQPEISVEIVARMSLSAGLMRVPNSRLKETARAMSSCGSEMPAGVILSTTSAAV